MDKPIESKKMPANPWEIVYRGVLFCIEKHKIKDYERAIRPPGARMILRNSEGKLLITKEHRNEISGIDYRVPGGKVFNYLEEYLEVRGNNEALIEAAKIAGQKEALEEAGVQKIENLEIIKKSTAGATVEWDLYFIRGNIKEMGAQELKDDEAEQGIEIGFYTDTEVLQLIKEGKINEGRLIAVLMQELTKA
ncbi:MAG: NUDIX domain-containing protein [Candidatus Vogelbacteria bacterium]|nr:NUDIX domain-containing protein [Candidatus Vogelbacteria bacterium]